MALLMVSLPAHAALALALALGLPEERTFTCNSDTDPEDPSQMHPNRSKLSKPRGSLGNAAQADGE